MESLGVIELKHRFADLTDFKRVYELYMDEVSNPYLTYDPMSEKDFSTIFGELLTSKTLYVVELDDRIIGTYRLIPKMYRQAHTIYLGSFVIDASCRGKGIGSKILEHICQNAVNKGKIRIELTVDLKNASAIALYRKAGFEIEGHIRKSYKTSSSSEYLDEYLMSIIF